VEILHPPTREMLFWNRALGRWISPRPDQENFFTRMLGVILVTPSALFANLSVSYQAYLFLLFHRSRLVRAAHALLMPLIMSAVFAGLCTIDVAGVNAGLIALGLLLAWYVVQALANRIFLVALCMVPITCGEYFLGRRHTQGQRRYHHCCGRWFSPVLRRSPTLPSPIFRRG
jgi:hypothetical protein